jgi:cytidyltransferase-like protein
MIKNNFLKVSFGCIFSSGFILFFLFFISFVAQGKSLNDIPNQQGIKVGIYIGTFDPPHLGHVRVAKAALDFGQLDYLLLLPNENAHHKPQSTPFHLRHAMTQEIISGDPRIITPEVPKENSLGYLRQTLHNLKKQKSQVTLVGILGTDVVEKIVKNVDNIYEDQKFWMGIVDFFLVNQRGGFDTTIIPERIGGRPVYQFFASDEGLSSTQMRNMVAQKRSELYQHLTERVVVMIQEYHLWSHNYSCRLVFLKPALKVSP